MILTTICGVCGALTFTAITDDVIDPGSGFTTVTWIDMPCCAVVAVPVAVSWVDDTNFVVSACVPNITLAPLTNLLPEIVIEKLPTATAVGETPVTVGTGFSSVIMVLPERLLSDEEVASMLMEFGLGRVAGAVYMPVALIIPSGALPPTTPFTDQTTAWLTVPLTLAVNWSVSPARTLPVAGVTATLEDGCVFAFPAPMAAQPVSRLSASERTSVVPKRVDRIQAISRISDPPSRQPSSELSCSVQPRRDA